MFDTKDRIKLSRTNYLNLCLSLMSYLFIYSITYSAIFLEFNK